MSRKSAKGVPKPIGSFKTQESSDFKVFLAVPSPYHPDISDNFKRTVNVEEEIPLPAVTHERSLNPKEAEAALRDLFSGGTDNSSTFTNNADAVVKGFRPGIRLLPHQVPSRAWMRDREDFTKKKAGGILADDMG
jgi:hypothetical protein